MSEGSLFDVKYLLEPVGFGREHLNTIEIDINDDQIINLGRNSVTTKSTSPIIPHIEFLSRNHVEIIVENKALKVKYVGRSEGLLTKNGEKCSAGMVAPLSIGDTISLLGDKAHFNFKVKQDMKRKSEIINIEEIDSPVAKKAANENSSNNIETVSISIPSAEIVTPQAGSNVTTKAIESHLECMICYDFITYAHTLPCGDSFCYECIASWASRKTTCPHCQQTFRITQMVPNRLLDNVIRELLENNKKNGDIETLQQYEEWENKFNQGKVLKTAATTINTMDRSKATGTGTTTTNRRRIQSSRQMNTNNGTTFGYDNTIGYDNMIANAFHELGYPRWQDGSTTIPSVLPNNSVGHRRFSNISHHITPPAYLTTTAPTTTTTTTNTSSSSSSSSSSSLNNSQLPFNTPINGGGNNRSRIIVGITNPVLSLNNRNNSAAVSNYRNTSSTSNVINVETSHTTTGNGNTNTNTNTTNTVVDLT